MNALAALNTARRAWELSQPQLTITGWADMFDGLDEQRAGASLLIEPVAPPFSPRDGLDTAFDGDGANHFRAARRPQKGA